MFNLPQETETPAHLTKVDGRALTYKNYKLFYPSAMSKIIITTKPNITLIVPVLECSPKCASGMSSSVTTYIMVPAAKESSQGIKGVMVPAAKTTEMPKIGSTTPERAPYRKARPVLIPS